MLCKILKSASLRQNFNFKAGQLGLFLHLNKTWANKHIVLYILVVIVLIYFSFKLQLEKLLEQAFFILWAEQK